MEGATGDSHCLPFRTESGAIYLYDDLSGVVLPVDGGPTAASLPRLAPFRSHVQRFRTAPEPWTAERVARAVSLSPSLQMTLIVTESCTLRCRYCVYGGTYDNSRPHSGANMSVDTAEKAVRLLAELQGERTRRAPGRRPALGFYGGEPLLRREVIRAAIRETERLGLECTFNLTTNGTIDDDDTIDLLARNHFSVAVSLDGPPSEHDRNRVYPDGRGSFSRVMGFVRRLRAAKERLGSPAATMPYFILVTADRATDFKAVSEFFDDRPDLLAGAAARISTIFPFRTSYYNCWKAEDLERSRTTAGSLWPGYAAAVRSGLSREAIGFRDWFFGVNLRTTLHGLAVESGPLRAACVPGTRVAVDHLGRVHICERVNSHYPIGSLDDGLNYAYIAELLNTLQEYFAGRCSECPVKRLCGACFSHVLVDGSLNLETPKEFCRDAPDLYARNLAALFSLLETTPEYLATLMPPVEELEQDRTFNA